jgi:hypothetical protein
MSPVGLRPEKDRALDVQKKNNWKLQTRLLVREGRVIKSVIV